MATELASYQRRGSPFPGTFHTRPWHTALISPAASYRVSLSDAGHLPETTTLRAILCLFVWDSVGSLDNHLFKLSNPGPTALPHVCPLVCHPGWAGASSGATAWMRALTLNSVTGSYLSSGDAAPRLGGFMSGLHVIVPLANMERRSLWETSWTGNLSSDQHNTTREPLRRSFV